MCRGGKNILVRPQILVSYRAENENFIRNFFEKFIQHFLVYLNNLKCDAVNIL